LTWEKPTFQGAISEYYGNKAGYTNEPVAAIGAWIIDQLEEKLHHQHTISGQEAITYSWWNSIDPKKILSIPAVAIAIDLINDPNKMSYGIFDNGNFIPADLLQGYITVVTLARSVQMRDAIDSHVTAVLEKIILTETDHPIIYVCKDEQPRDVNFSSTVDHMASTMFQVMSELGFTKLTRLRFGVMRDYLNIYEYSDGTNETDNLFKGLIRTSEYNTEGVIPTWRSIKLTFKSNY
jgi:hypothetical protein